MKILEMINRVLESPDPATWTKRDELMYNSGLKNGKKIAVFNAAVLTVLAVSVIHSIRNT